MSGPVRGTSDYEEALDRAGRRQAARDGEPTGQEMTISQAAKKQLEITDQTSLSLAHPLRVARLTV
jgi:hypothetical protein